MASKNIKGAIRTLRKDINKKFHRGDQVEVIEDKRPYKNNYAVLVKKVGSSDDETVYVFTKYLK